MGALLNNRYIKSLLAVSGTALIIWFAVQQDIQILIARMPHEMVELCKAGGVQIHEKVDNVRSFASLPYADDQSLRQIAAGQRPDAYLRDGCFPCLQELVVDGYESVETYIVGARHRPRGLSHVGYDLSYANKTGLYRLRLHDRRLGGAPCAPFDDLIAFVKANDGQRSLATHLKAFAREYSAVLEKMNNFCVVADRIDRIEAPYEVRHEPRRSIKPNTLFGQMYKIIQTRSFVYSLVDGKVLAEAKFFYYEFDHLGGTHAQCGTYDLPPIRSVLSPATAPAEGGRK